MEIQNIIDQKQWDQWLADNASTGNFTQSWAWGDVLIAEGKKVERLAVVEDGDVLVQAQVVYNQVFFGWQYTFCPQGIIVNKKLENRNFEIGALYKYFFNFLSGKDCIFFRIEPESIQFPVSNFQLHKTIDINPSATLILDLNKTEAELLSGMHPKTRYNIHLAEKKNLKIKNEKDLEVFWNLMNKTGSRDKFGLHRKDHYSNVLLSESVYQLTAYASSEPIACAVFVRFGNTFTYLYGASDYEYRNLMAPYLLQWEGVKMGKSFGCARYDFFGVAPRCHSDPESSGEESLKSNERDPSAKPQDDIYQYDPKHQYAGVTRFKLGFGGYSQQMPGTFDLVMDGNRYFIYGLLRKLRRLF